jgi:UDP-N-acetylglucosamine--N-acetylmuramyl-(pentapeptide) pyrophosphoryl-undecaprenol N-acetylglucosamine transferase
MALAQELRRRGHEIHLMTDHRVASYGQQFPARDTHIVPSATPSVRNPIKFARAALMLTTGVLVSRRMLGKIKPAGVVAFGGYPVVPSFVAARMLRIPGVLHEANAVMGRANRALAGLADRIALSFARTQHAERFPDKAVVTGNPVRDRVLALASMPYPELSADAPLRLVITGGSQGARALSELVPPAITALPDGMRHRLRIVQQCRPEDLDRVAETYRRMKVNVDLQPFFTDLPERMAEAHLVIARAGASTIAELAVLGRPSILIPLPGALDADQKKNALLIDDAKAGWIVEQATISPPSLANRLASLFGDPDTLKSAAMAAKSLGQPQAVEKLADLVEEVAGRGKTT